MRIEWADRIANLPPYLFAEIDRKKNEMIAKGVDVIDLGVGDPDIPTPSHIVDALKRAAEDPKTHRYPSYTGMLVFREEASRWCKRRFDLDFDPTSEVLALIGSKEGIAHTPLAFINPGDIALVPDPGYPVYPVSVSFAGGIPYKMPLLKENGFLPDLDSIPSDIASKAKLMFLNYPNNPTSAVAGKDFFEKVVEFAYKHNIIVCHDAAYTEISFDGYTPPSFMEVKGAKDVGIEYHSLSKTFNMTGWRIGFAVGNKDVIAGLGKVKTNIDSGAFEAIQYAAIEALKNYDVGLEERRKIYQERRDIFCKGLDDAGLRYIKPLTTFYIWFEVPSGYTSKDFAAKMLEEAGVVVTPGNGFGEYGEGFARVSMTFDTDRIAEAAKRLGDFKI